MSSKRHYLLHPVVWLAALGYFVDIYDLLLFSIIRIPSLNDIGVDNVTGTGLLILNTQMFGSSSETKVIPAPNSPARPIPAIKRMIAYCVPV